MKTASPLRVSRSEIAASDVVRRLHAGSLLFFGLALPALPALLHRSALGGVPAMVFGVVSGVWVLAGCGCGLGGRLRSNAAVATSWILPALCLASTLPHGAPVLIGFGLCAPLAALALHNRVDVASHLGAVVICALVPWLLGLTETGYLPAAAMLTLSICAVSVGVAGVFEIAEAQGQRLRDLSERDPLTGLANRRVVEAQLCELLAGWAAWGDGFAVLALDLNDFKGLNDRFGHDAGDHALIIAARVLDESLPPQTICARVGGDEFLAILRGADRDAALAARHNLRAALATVHTPAGPLTSGVGFSVCPQDGVTSDQLQAAADASLLLDKGCDRPDVGARCA